MKHKWRAMEGCCPICGDRGGEQCPGPFRGNVCRVLQDVGLKIVSVNYQGGISPDTGGHQQQHPGRGGRGAGRGGGGARTW
jgi:hypothetical protein